ncbi:hypothetical protein HY496_02000 [Candidatus Woesearchaeota archaeon]|nr:hypothetical protein [Candidatus Woesearchaeota archaeon]
MPNFISFFPKDVKPKGLNQKAIPSLPKIKKYLFDDDFENIQKINSMPSFVQQEPTLFYPGSGCDILIPLLVMERLFPKLGRIRFCFVDKNNTLELIKTVLDDVGVSFSEHEGRLDFYWNNLFVSLSFIQEDVFRMTLPSFDIYFERSFRIMKEADSTYEQRIFANLRKKGIIISDSGFRDQSLVPNAFPPELSSYGEMIVGFKK